MKYAKGEIKNIYAIRIEPDEDVMQSLLKFCTDNKIGNGVIISGIGSLKGCSFFDPEELKDSPGLYGYGEAIAKPCPIELISLSGIICTEDDGKISIHAHADFADEKGEGYGGHFKEGNYVLTTVEIVIGEISGIKMSRSIDSLRGVPVFCPIQID